VNIAQHPDLLDQLAARHAVGLLSPRVRSRLQAQARHSAAIRARLLLWQERINAMAELPAAAPQTHGALAPSINVWKRIENSLQTLAQGLDKHVTSPLLEQAQQALASMQRTLSWWRAGAAVAGVAAVSLVALNMQQATRLEGSRSEVAKLDTALKAQQQAQAAQHQVQYVAVLADDKSSATVLVTFDPAKQRMVLQRVGAYQEAADKSLQLWALPQGGAPQSLGVMGAGNVLRLQAAPEQIRNVPLLAVSLEPKGGVPSSGGPTGPVLFKGALLQTAL
jgi:anti-sigma-K factor RskA